MRLENKVAVVTGAGSGIGKEIARLFVREGAKVMIADHNQERADEVAKELGTGRAIGIAVDVTDEAQVEGCFAKPISARRSRFTRAMCAVPFLLSTRGPAGRHRR